MSTVHLLNATDEVTFGAAADRYIATQPLAPDDRQGRREHVPVLAHRLGQPAVQARGLANL